MNQPGARGGPVVGVDVVLPVAGVLNPAEQPPTLQIQRFAGDHDGNGRRREDGRPLRSTAATARIASGPPCAPARARRSRRERRPADRTPHPCGRRASPCSTRPATGCRSTAPAVSGPARPRPETSGPLRAAARTADAAGGSFVKKSRATVGWTCRPAQSSSAATIAVSRWSPRGIPSPTATGGEPPPPGRRRPPPETTRARGRSARAPTPPGTGTAAERRRPARRRRESRRCPPEAERPRPEPGRCSGAAPLRRSAFSAPWAARSATARAVGTRNLTG